MVLLSNPPAIAQSRWGCTALTGTALYRLRKHLVDHERSARMGEAVARCGEFLHYVDGATEVRPGDPCSGRQMVSERTVVCRTCQRREAEASVEVVSVPVTAMAQLVRNLPGQSWATISQGLDAYVVASVNALL